jgi:hypothetical protein
MYFFWFLPAVLLAVPLFAVWRIRQSRKLELRNRLQSVIEQSALDEVVPEPVGAETRQMKWISINELMRILAECGDLIVVDLRTDDERILYPVPAPSVLPVTMDDLDSVLGWLPADRSVAFCGACNLCIFLIETSPCMRGSAPLYILKGDLRLAEVA